MSVLNKLKHNRKAVSPVVAAILLIGLVVVAGAAVAFIVLPMLNPPFTAGKITIGSPVVSANAGDFRNATMTLLISNSHTSAATLDTVTAFVHNGGGGVPSTFSGFVATPATIAAGGAETISIFFAWASGGPMNTGETATSITLSFTSGTTTVSVIFTGF